MSGQQNPIEPAASSAEVVCAKCQHLNPHRRNVCDACGAHLYVVCHYCGHRNQRSSGRCVECGRNLHRAWHKRLFRGLLGKNPKISLAQILLLLAAIAIGFTLVIFFSDAQVPEGGP
jgi:hypothetical protein